MSEDIQVAMVDAGQHHAVCLDTAGMYKYNCLTIKPRVLSESCSGIHMHSNTFVHFKIRYKQYALIH